LLKATIIEDSFGLSDEPDDLKTSAVYVNIVIYPEHDANIPKMMQIVIP